MTLGLDNWSWKQINVSFEAFLVGNQGSWALRLKFWPFFTSRSSQWPPYWARSFRSISDSRDLEPVFAILLEAKTSLDVAFKAQAFNEGKFLSSYFLQSSMSTAVNVGFSRPPQLRRLSCFELSAKDFLSAMSSRTLASNDLNCQPCLWINKSTSWQSLTWAFLVWVFLVHLSFFKASWASDYWYGMYTY